MGKAQIPSDLNSLRVPIDQLRPYGANPRRGDVSAIRSSLQAHGQYKPILANRRTSEVLAGNHTWRAAKDLGWDEIAVTWVDVSDEEAARIVLIDNKTSDLAVYDEEALLEMLQSIPSLDGTGYSEEALAELEAALAEPAPPARTLSDRFGVPPFSVLDARQGYWRTRKEEWLALGIKSELGRRENLLKLSETVLEPDPEKRRKKGAVPNDKFNIPGYYRMRAEGRTDEDIIAAHIASGSTVSGGTSVFDPVLCELVVRWFSPPDGMVLDPFAGGSVRGIVASRLGRRYMGVDLRAEQIAANREQAESIGSDKQPAWNPEWVEGDARQLEKLLPKMEADLIFTCPPYFDLEQYSEDERDLSNAGSYEEFMDDLRSILRQAFERLREDRFAVIVVGEIRDRDGIYRGFVHEAGQAMQMAGGRYYNEAILVTSVGTLPIRVSAMFSKARKLGKTHQNVLVFCKGDPRKAAEACGDVEIDPAVEFGEPL